MKKIVFLLLATLSFTLVSCTADPIPTNAKSADIGGQSGTVPPPPPKP